MLRHCLELFSVSMGAPQVTMSVGTCVAMEAALRKMKRGDLQWHSPEDQLALAQVTGMVEVGVLTLDRVSTAIKGKFAFIVPGDATSQKTHFSHGADATAAVCESTGDRQQPAAGSKPSAHVGLCTGEAGAAIADAYDRS